MVGVFLAFGIFAHTVIIKEIGIGLTIAVAVDATLVRILLVPAIMRVLGRVSWWTPTLPRFHRRLGLGRGLTAESKAAGR
jgi:RND superfamily putative drug exporter